MSILDLDAIEARANSYAVGAECQDFDRDEDDEFTDYDADACDLLYARQAACEDIPALTAELRFTRSVRDSQAAVIRKQAREIDALRYERDQALSRESEERAARIAAEEARAAAEELAKPLKVREVLP